ncbi:MAG: alpha/beta fold hydrolase [Alphaproteobacteria bacterium]
MASGDLRHKVTFLGALGEPLAARLDLPAGPPRAFAVFAHCFTCSKDIFAAARIAAGLTEAGYGVLRFDFTGLGASAGDFANTNYSSNVDDLVAAADWLRANHAAPTLLVGHSLGGAAVLVAATRIAEVRAVATIGAPADPAHVTRALGDAVADIEAEGEAKVEIAGRAFRIRRQFVDDLRNQDQLRAIRALKAALMVMHAPRDEIVGIENARMIFEAAHHPKSFVSLDTADHLLTDRADAVYVARVLAAWAERYVEAAAVAAGAAEEDAGGVLVSETGLGRFQQAIAVGPHRLTADEPRAAGGDDSGPSPYDLLSAALGACTAMTLRMYAGHKQLPLDHVAVRVVHDRIHAEDCATCETREGKVDRFVRTIALQGDLDDAQTARMLQIADRCPVHQTLHREVLVETALADAPAEAPA